MLRTPYLGPTFRLVETLSRENFIERGGFRPRATPLLVTGLVTEWPAWKRWSLEYIADLVGDVEVAPFQDGLIEQGATKRPIPQRIAPYIRSLGDAARANDNGGDGLCPDHLLATLGADDGFRLNWEFLTSFTPNRLYLGQWEILRAIPELKDDLRLSELWRWRSNWPSAWIGPARTVTGLHTDYPDNWFCQIRGEKEFILFSSDQARLLSPSSKYDCGSVLSRVDVMRLHEKGPEAEVLSSAQGTYARVRPGDALFVPSGTWHSVVALQPSLSLSVFGLTLAERLTGGVKEVVLDALHHLGWYRSGDCTCHGTRTGTY